MPDPTGSCQDNSFCIFSKLTANEDNRCCTFRALSLRESSWLLMSWREEKQGNSIRFDPVCLVEQSLVVDRLGREGEEWCSSASTTDLVNRYWIDFAEPWFESLFTVWVPKLNIWAKSAVHGFFSWLSFGDDVAAVDWQTSVDSRSIVSGVDRAVCICICQSTGWLRV